MAVEHFGRWQILGATGHAALRQIRQLNDDAALVLPNHLPEIGHRRLQRGLARDVVAQLLFRALKKRIHQVTRDVEDRFFANDQPVFVLYRKILRLLWSSRLDKAIG